MSEDRITIAAHHDEVVLYLILSCVVGGLSSCAVGAVAWLFTQVEWAFLVAKLLVGSIFVLTAYACYRVVRTSFEAKSQEWFPAQPEPEARPDYDAPLTEGEKENLLRAAYADLVWFYRVGRRMGFTQKDWLPTGQQYWTPRGEKVTRTRYDLWCGVLKEMDILPDRKQGKTGDRLSSLAQETVEQEQQEPKWQVSPPSAVSLVSRASRKSRKRKKDLEPDGAGVGKEAETPKESDDVQERRAE